MTEHRRTDQDRSIAERRVEVLGSLDGALPADMLDTMRDAWRMLEQIATDRSAHEHAVSERMFWESLQASAERRSA